MASLRLALAALLLAPALPALALQAQERADGIGPALRALMAEDARLQSIGWRLARANAAFCANTAPGIGLLVLDAGSFGDPGAIRQALRLTGDFAVDAVAAGSPAERSGLRAGSELLAIGALRLDTLPGVAPRDYRRAVEVHDRIDRDLAAGGRVVLTLRDTSGQETVATVTGEPACRSRFELSDDGKRAAADGARVIVDRAALTRNPDDDAAATLVAHELAHNILGHPARLDATSRSPAAVAATEREADRLAVWLIANAGYPPEAGARFAGHYLRRIDAGLFRVPTHDGWHERQALYRQEAEAVRLAQRRTQLPLDWRPRFRR